MQNVTDKELSYINSIRVKATQKINNLVESGRNDPEARSFIYSLKRFLEELDNLEEELMYVPLAKYVDIKNRFPGSPRS